MGYISLFAIMPRLDPRLEITDKFSQILLYLIQFVTGQNRTHNIMVEIGMGPTIQLLGYFFFPQDRIDNRFMLNT
jgi:hypothetical protein